MKKGFTLAEVLITLAIIGIVAALTIPTVVNNYQKKAQYTAFMKMYNTLTNVFDLAQGEFGTPSNWSFDNSNRSQTARVYIYPYLKISKICEDASIVNCIPSYDVKFLEGTAAGTSSNIFQGNGLTVIMQDGSILYIRPYRHSSYQDTIGNIETYFDTNGEKGPNTIGRDIFIMEYKYSDNKWGFNFNETGFGPDYCNPSSTYQGQGCAAKLLQEGKMDY